MANWEPQNESLATTGALSNSTPKMPTLQVPEVGDTIRFVAHQWGGYSVYVEGMSIEKGAKVIEANVTGIKTAKVVLE